MLTYSPKVGDVFQFNYKGENDVAPKLRIARVVTPSANWINAWDFQKNAYRNFVYGNMSDVRFVAGQDDIVLPRKEAIKKIFTKDIDVSGSEVVSWLKRVEPDLDTVTYLAEVDIVVGKKKVEKDPTISVCENDGGYVVISFTNKDGDDLSVQLNRELSNITIFKNKKEVADPSIETFLKELNAHFNYKP